MTPPLMTTLPSPLPSSFLTTRPGIGGAIKQRAEDFLVDEIPAYEPSGEGEHVYLGIEKQNVSHAEMIATIARTFGVPRSRIGFAGMKDKHAITRQAVSLHLHKDPPSLEINHERIKVLWSMRHRNRLRRGHLRGNRFSIRIREVDPTQAPAVRMVLRELEQAGVPNFFGPQRFGYRGNTHLLGRLVVKGEFDALLSELLGTTGTPYPEHQQAQRELFDEGKFREAQRCWSVADRAELNLLQSLSTGMSPEQAVKRLDRATKSFWVSALKAAALNSVLEHRLQAGTLGALVAGDLAWKHDKGSVFRVSPAMIASGELEPRLTALEISPSGPMWGKEMTRADGKVDEAELAALSAFGVTPEELASCPASDAGARRPLRVPIALPEIDAGVDEHGGYIRLAFSLPPGAYATVVTREIMKSAPSRDDSE